MVVSKLELLVLLNQCIYCAAAIPQMVKNYRRKTGVGLGYGLLFSTFNSLAALLFYFVCLRLPISYWVSLGLQLIFCAAVLGQRLYYARHADISVPLCLFVINTVLLFLCIPAAMCWPGRVGHMGGWLGLVLALIGRAPQVIKVQRERSVYGFSYGSLLMGACATLLELGIVLAFGLPLQTLLMSSVSLLFFSIFTAQFWFFKWRKE